LSLQNLSVVKGKPRNSDNLINEIEKAATSMKGKYLIDVGESYEFTHHYFKKAVLLSSDLLFDYFLRASTFIEIKEYFLPRCSKCLSLQNLSVVKGKPSMGSVSKLIISSIVSL
jgi:hypothetical protein